MKVLLTLLITVLLSQFTLAQTNIPSNAELDQLHQEAVNAKIEKLVKRIETLELRLKEAKLNACLCNLDVENKDTGVSKYVESQAQSGKNCTNSRCAVKQTSIPSPVNRRITYKPTNQIKYGQTRYKCRNGVCRKIKK
tara:strand:+ start:1409 stop:1822 length:414 start_codon:yes stop_codon:yes gene_type:complete